MIIPALRNSINGRDEMGWKRDAWRSESRRRTVKRHDSAPRPAPAPARGTLAAGFTLVELLVSTAVIALLMLILIQVTNNISSAWRATTEKVEKFQEARDGFEAMTRRISQATLNTYWDYYNVAGVPINQAANPGSFLPFSYGRQSDLRFICGPMSNGAPGAMNGTSCTADLTNGSTLQGNSMLPYWPTHGIFFQAPLGNIAYADQPFYAAMDNLLNTWGYFLEVNCDADTRLNMMPGFLAGTTTPPPYRWRARLMELQVPTEYMNVYDLAASSVFPGGTSYVNRRDWYANFLQLPAPGTSSQMTSPNGSVLATQYRPGLSVRPARAIAENIVALIFLPKLSAVDETLRKTNGWSMLSPDYFFDSTIVPSSANPSGGASASPPLLTSAPLNPGAWLSNAPTAPEVAGINPRNQLPPEIQVIMIAIDERSAIRLLALTNTTAQQSTTSLSDPTFGGLYTSGSQLFTQAYTGGTQYYNQLGDAQTAATDLYTFTQKLVADKLTYRIFTTNVTIRGAKWSRAQTY
jgi:uncharacterized protein (TIGR02599 family)